jgi:prepilin-type N-terminal cleavage/methylation domain-containing protein
MKRAFTLIELIITMVILAIVSYIASGLIAKTYIASTQTTSINRANLKVEAALSIITNRLEYAINNTIVKRKQQGDFTLFPIEKAPKDFALLEWIGFDKESFEADTPPGWSGFCDIKQSTQNSITTPGSNLNLAQTIIKNLSKNKASLSSQNSVAIFFPGNFNYKNIGYKIVDFMHHFTLPFQNNGTALVINYIPSTTLTAPKLLISNPSKRIVEQYKLAWSAYTVAPTDCKNVNGNTLCNLKLYYNYRPWKNEQYTQGESSLLITNVSVFKTYATQNRIHIKLCIQDKYLGKKTISVCKEKVVYK